MNGGLPVQDESLARGLAKLYDIKYRYGDWKKQVKSWDPEKDDLALKQ